MTQLAGRRGKGDRDHRCRWCGSSLTQPTGRGRPRRYCRSSCRQQAYVARTKALRRADGDDVVIRRSDAEAVQSALYLLRAALEDVTNDLADDDSPDAVRAALEHLRTEAGPAAEIWLLALDD